MSGKGTLKIRRVTETRPSIEDFGAAIWKKWSLRVFVNWNDIIFSMTEFALVDISFDEVRLDITNSLELVPIHKL